MAKYNKGNIYNQNKQVLITCNNILYEGGATLDKILYPIGSIYMSVNSTNPSQLFGGVWEQINGRFLYCTNSASKQLGGENEHTLTTNEMPSHNHGMVRDSYTGNILTSRGDGGGGWFRVAFPPNPTIQSNSYRGNYMDSVGGGQPHNNMPAYFTVYCWYRVG